MVTGDNDLRYRKTTSTVTEKSLQPMRTVELWMMGPKVVSVWDREGVRTEGVQGPSKREEIDRWFPGSRYSKYVSGNEKSEVRRIRWKRYEVKVYVRVTSSECVNIRSETQRTFEV